MHSVWVKVEGDCLVHECANCGMRYMISSKPMAILHDWYVRERAMEWVRRKTCAQIRMKRALG